MVRIDSASSRPPPLVYVPAIVMEPTPIRETSSPPREMCFINVSLSFSAQAWSLPCRWCTATEPRAGRGWEPLTMGLLTGTPQPHSTARKVDGMAGGNNYPDTSDGIPNEARSSVRGEIQTFLTTRRARINPEQAGLPTYGAKRRRVSGLRRDEVALLAGISSQYYTKLPSAATPPASPIASSTASLA